MDLLKDLLKVELQLLEWEMFFLILPLHGLPMLDCNIVHDSHYQHVEEVVVVVVVVVVKQGGLFVGNSLFGDPGMGNFACSDDDHFYTH